MVCTGAWHDQEPDETQSLVASPPAFQPEVQIGAMADPVTTR